MPVPVPKDLWLALHPLTNADVEIPQTLSVREIMDALAEQDPDAPVMIGAGTMSHPIAGVSSDGGEVVSIDGL